MAFIQDDKIHVNGLKRELKHKTKLAKLRYKNKMEERFTRGNVRDEWQGLNTMVGRAQKPVQIQCPAPTCLARFNRTDPVEDWTPANASYPSAPISVEEWKATSILPKLHPREAPGPDGFKGGVVAQLVQLLLNASYVPRAHKETTIIPIPKVPHAKAMKDFRPAALTSILCKCPF